MNLYKITYIIFIIFFPFFAFGQKKKSDALKQKNYVELKKVIRTSGIDSIKRDYIEFYLYKAKKEKDTINIAEGYKYRSLLTFGDNYSLLYADSLISITKNINTRKHPALGYNLKGGILFNNGKYKEALDYYLKALKYSKRNKNQFQHLTIKFNIGLLKNHLGEREEALNIFKEYLKYVENTNGKYPKNLIQGLHAVADSYTYCKKYDSANIYINKGIIKSLKRADSIYYPSLVLASGINNYFNKNYVKAIDSLKKAKIKFILNKNESTRIAICNYYIGKALNDVGSFEESISYFESVDSILSVSLNVTPEIIDSYNYLINDSKRKDNIKKQIKYVNKLIRFDSVLDKNYKYLKNVIVKKYETPELLLDKEKLIKELNKEKNNSQLRTAILILTTLILLLLAFFLIKRNRTNNIKYNLIKAELNNRTKEYKSQDKISTPNKQKKLNYVEIPEEITQNILKKLKKFEESDNYTKKKYTLNSLAKELKTNSTYLSKVINEAKEINFSNYLNNLKVDYAIKRLNVDKKFRSYSIKAIAMESGFNTAQSFSVAFNKKTGIYPSFYIRKINKDLSSLR